MRALVDIAQHNGEGPVLLRDIVQRQGVTRNYLEQILIQLKAAGLVRSIRGVQGGFMLAKSPAEIRLSEVVQALEGQINLVECVADPKVCPRVEVCATHDLWGELSSLITQALASKTLQDLMEMQRRKEQTSALTYYI